MPKEIEKDKPHVFFHNGWWHVSRMPRRHRRRWLWNKTHWVIAQWNDGGRNKCCQKK